MQSVIKSAFFSSLVNLSFISLKLGALIIEPRWVKEDTFFPPLQNKTRVTCLEMRTGGLKSYNLS